MVAHVHIFPTRAPVLDGARRRRRRTVRSEPLLLTDEQRAWLGGHGFGPAGPPHDFTDPAVRAELVQTLRDCGALPPASATERSPRARGTRRVS
jgi:hypothetical protein